MNYTVRMTRREMFDTVYLPRERSSEMVQRKLQQRMKFSDWENLGFGRICVMGDYIYICLKEMPLERNRRLR